VKLPSAGLDQGSVRDDALLAQIEADLKSAAADYAGRTADQTFGTINASTTILASGPGTHIVNATGIDLGNGEKLVLKRDQSNKPDNVVINVSGEMKLNKAQIELENFTWEEILFNVDGKISSSGGGNESVFRGVFLSMSGAKMQFSPALIEGALYGAGDITLTSGADLISPVPLPVSGLLLAGGLLGFGALRFRKTSGKAAT